MGTIKAHLGFALKVAVALIIINFILDFLGAKITNYVYSPAKSLGLAKSASA